MLNIDRLSRQFGAVQALIDIDLEVRSGEVIGLIGPNGSGKTTLLNVITGIYSPTRGEIFFKSKRIDGLKNYQIINLGIARTFQNLRIFKRMTVFENVRSGQHGLSNIGIKELIFASRNRSSGREKVDELLDAVGLYERKDWLADKLPLPDQRRLELARALIRAPDLLMLDEPSGGMTPKETKAMAHLIQKIALTGRTCILIEHKMDMITALCSRLCVLNFGRKIAEGSPHDVLKNELVLEAYIGAENCANA